MNTLQHIHIHTLSAELEKYAQRLWYIDPAKVVNYKDERELCIFQINRNLSELRKAIHALEKGGDTND